MAKIYNSDLTNEIEEGAKIQDRMDVVPNQIADKVVPTMEVNPNMLRKINLIKANANTGAAAISLYTAPAATTRQRVYLTSVQAAYSKNAACDAASGVLYVTIAQGGATLPILALPHTTLTQENQAQTLTLPKPLAIDPGSAVILTASGAITAGVLSKAVAFTGYIVNEQ